MGATASSDLKRARATRPSPTQGEDNEPLHGAKRARIGPFSGFQSSEGITDVPVGPRTATSSKFVL